MTTGLRPATFEQLQLNSGVFLAGFEYSAATDASSLKTAIAEFIKDGDGVLGATRGGGSFECTPSMRTIEADGMRYPFMGSTVNDMWTVKLKTTLLEVNPENFKRALACADIATESTTDKKIVTIRTDIRTTDYIPKLCWVGDTSKGYVLIELDNALNVSGANFTFTDKGEGTIPVEFQAHQSSLENQDMAPCRIIFFNAAASAASTDENA